jgi:integrase
MGKLTYAALKGLLRRTGRHSDGDGLYFRVVRNDKAYWAYRYRAGGRDREISIGRFPEISLLDARAKHAALRKTVVADKADPLAAKRANSARAEVAIPTFGEAADAYIKAHGGQWRSHVHLDQWIKTLTRDCAPIRSMPVDQVNTAAVLKVLTPMWTRTPETASRLRGRIEAVLAAAQVEGHIEESRPNPARWRGWLDKKLPNPMKLGDRHHHDAMPYADIPAFMARIKDWPALGFVILTAVRSAEALGATFDEVDLDTAVWTVPGNRCKTGENHRVPLSAPALAIVRGQLQTRGDNPFIFPGPVHGRPLDKNALGKIMRQAGAGDHTVHGFRSAFRMWCTEVARAEYEVAEAALSHVVGNKTAVAYDRGDRLELRRDLMDKWARYLSGESSHVVVAIGKRRRR